MRDYEEKSYYEIQLDNKQLVLVFLAALTLCVLIFVLGVMVGKGQKEAEMASVVRPEVSAKTQPDVAPPQQPQSNVSNEKEKEQEKPVRQKNKEKPKQDYTFYDLDKPETQKSELEKADQEPEAPAPEKPAPAVKPVTEKPVTEKPAKSTFAADTHQYTVQVMATASKTKATEELTMLKSKGYKAFMDDYKTESGNVFKVRVGRYPDPDSAKEMAQRLKRDLRLDTWVAVLD